MTTDEDVLILEDEAHLQTHHVTTNVKRGEQDETMRNPVNGGKQQSKIYNTHDGRLKQKVDDSHNQNNLRSQYNGQPNTQQYFNQNNYSSSLSKR